jgi:hypothetical protein
MKLLLSTPQVHVFHPTKITSKFKRIILYDEIDPMVKVVLNIVHYLPNPKDKLYTDV